MMNKKNTKEFTIGERLNFKDVLVDPNARIYGAKVGFHIFMGNLIIWIDDYNIITRITYRRFKMAGE